VEVPVLFGTVFLTGGPLGFVDFVCTLIVWLDLYQSVSERTSLVSVRYPKVRIIVVPLIVLGAHIGYVNLFGTPG
jgi:hypothetical protein